MRQKHIATYAGVTVKLLEHNTYNLIEHENKHNLGVKQ